jgi:hypothetical protein
MSDDFERADVATSRIKWIQFWDSENPDATSVSLWYVPRFECDFTTSCRTSLSYALAMVRRSDPLSWEHCNLQRLLRLPPVYKCMVDGVVVMLSEDRVHLSSGCAMMEHPAESSCPYLASRSLNPETSPTEDGVHEHGTRNRGRRGTQLPDSEAAEPQAKRHHH